MTVVDIGANLGYYTLIASFHVQKVIAFEPEVDNARFLEDTIQHNKRRNVCVIKKGLGERDELLPLSIHPYNKGKHTLLSLNEEEIRKELITITTLDKELEILDIPHIDLIKIDIEGWEAKAIRGAKQIITRDHPMIMFEFSHERITAAGDDPQDLFNFLNLNGYKLYIINEVKKYLEPIEPNIDSVILKNNIYINILAKI